MSYEIAILPGDYIGPEIMAAGLKVFAAAAKVTNFNYHTTTYPFGGAAIDQVGEPLPAATISGTKAADAILLAAIGWPKWDQAPKRPEQGLLAIRKALNLFANIRPTHVNPALVQRSPLKAEIAQGTDFVIVRELTSGIYFGEPRYQHAAEALDTMYYSRKEIQRILKAGFELAKQRRQHVTVVDKANVLATSKLWRAIANEMATDYPEIRLDFEYVDAAAMKIVQQPTNFDVIITENLFGDILSDEAATVTGSLGTIPSESRGDSGPSLYEPIHGSAPDIAGKGIADPLSMINSITMMLRNSFQETQTADLIDAAVTATLQEGILPPDLGGKATTQVMTKAIIQHI
ncbi:3-isopropylmalate dehydrogenase [Loigolactobacillus backii]|uniref:3-isopropylmalate dehydrogenase n=1 Tax=Loigolactobacillus backii TaxID=375175 RepID=UPI000C1CA8CE|nr:3-isopropylmalate dehydrogenase [Loigolactobacillus backii]PIO82497.1 3-isopropylmalate dehydrogenase [Loigolactobacillus backii]